MHLVCYIDFYLLTIFIFITFLGIIPRPHGNVLGGNVKGRDVATEKFLLVV